ncbi:hypothetical protein FB446DRAFT_795597 [Lentinula raphanica]|nr:hypothetical protein FB446DRAFT_795597 [Lentinula raphanica]
MSSLNNQSTQFLYYQPNNSASSQHVNMPRTTAETQHRAIGRPKGPQVAPKFILPVKETMPKRSVGRPRGSGHKQKAEKEAERQRQLNPQPHQPVGLVIPATSSNPSSWDMLMQPRSTSSTFHQSAPSPLNPTPTVSNRTSSNSQLLSKLTLAEPPTTETSTDMLSANSESAMCIDSASIMPSGLSSSRRTVLARAQAITSSDVENHPKLPRVEPDPESLLHSIITDNLDINNDEDAIDSLIAEGIGEDDMGEASEDEGEFEEDEDGFEADEDHGNKSSPRDASSEQQPKKKTIRKPYPAWFQASLNQAISQVKADRTSLAGRSRLYAAGTFWFPEQSIWSVLQKIHGGLAVLIAIKRYIDTGFCLAHTASLISTLLSGL